jgi:hypothetical protein
LKRDWLLIGAKLARFIFRHGVALESHALMQNSHNQHTVLVVQEEIAWDSKFIRLSLGARCPALRPLLGYSASLRNIFSNPSR